MVKQITGKEMARKLPKDHKDFARALTDAGMPVVQIDYKWERWDARRSTKQDKG
jgi:hypothetical protein